MRYVVGYGPRQRGVDGINLAATLSRSSGATLDLVSVLPSDAPTFHRYSPDQAFNAEIEEQGREWLDDGLSRVPEGVHAEGYLRRADSITQGLLDSAADPDRGEAALIVVGTYHRVRSGRLGLGSLADALLHASAVPVALAPAEYRCHAGVTRITCAVGLRPRSTPQRWSNGQKRPLRRFRRWTVLSDRVIRSRTRCRACTSTTVRS